jgi:predicted Zn-dependent protease
VALEPQHRQARALLAVSRMKTGDVDAGEQEARQLLASQPPLNDVDLTITFAEILYERGSLDEALVLVEEAVRFAPKHPIPELWRARLLLRLERIEDAVAAAERSVQLSPELPFAHDLLVRLYRLQGRDKEARREADSLREFEQRKTKGAEP